MDNFPCTSGIIHREKSPALAREDATTKPHECNYSSTEGGNYTTGETDEANVDMMGGREAAEATWVASAAVERRALWRHDDLIWLLF